MNEKELLKRLHEHEKRILKSFEGKESITFKELQQSTSLNKDSLEKASLWAKVKGVIKIDEEVSEFIELTKEGEEYLNKGLPERNLLKSLEKGKKSIPELKKDVEKFNIGLVWVKKNNWVTIQKGQLELTKEGSRVLTEAIPEEKMLSQLREGKHSIKSFDRLTLEKMEKRGLIKKSAKKKRELTLTSLGKKILPKLEIKDEIAQLTPQILKEKTWKTKVIRPYDVTLPSTKIHPAKKHYMTQIIEYIRKIWTDMGFKEMTGPLVDISFWNFDALYQPQDHPARDMADTFYMKVPKKGKLPENRIVEAVKNAHENGGDTGSKGWQYKWDPELARKCILRTHTTSLSARTLAQLRKDIENDAMPAKYFSVGRCFRNETIDWKHLAEFYQTDGIVVDENVNFRKFLFYLKRYFSKLGFPKARFRPAYFPYTEMSTEIEVWHPKHKEWIELGGSGIFRPEVVKPLLGKDIPVLAWGPGFGRIVMMNYKIEDIRELYMNDLKQLREAKIWLGG
jgi:phenylalanyl-tRNA synthetase alpha chain